MSSTIWRQRSPPLASSSHRLAIPDYLHEIWLMPCTGEVAPDDLHLRSDTPPVVAVAGGVDADVRAQDDAGRTRTRAGRYPRTGRSRGRPRPPRRSRGRVPAG